MAVVKTAPATVLEDYARLMRLARYTDFLPKGRETALKINISWQKFYPACSSTPWQIEGVVRTMLEDGYARDSLYACHNRTVVVSARKGEVRNKHKPVVEKYGLRNIHLYEGEEWVRYEPKARMLVLKDIFPDGILIPKRFIGNNVLYTDVKLVAVFVKYRAPQLIQKSVNAFDALCAPGLYRLQRPHKHLVKPH